MVNQHLERLKEELKEEELEMHRKKFNSPFRNITIGIGILEDNVVITTNRDIVEANKNEVRVANSGGCSIVCSKDELSRIYGNTDFHIYRTNVRDVLDTYFMYALGHVDPNGSVNVMIEYNVRSPFLGNEKP